MYKILGSEAELSKYFNFIMPDLLPNELYFISLSARNKYLTKEEREELCLGRTEMFERRIIKEASYDRVKRTIRKFEVNEGAYTTKNGSNIPEKCLVVYINLNPSCVLKAYKEFNRVYSEYMYELTNNVVKGNDVSNILYRIKRIENVLKTSIQKSRGTKHWIDIDCDIPKNEEFILNFKKEWLDDHNIRNYVIETKSGYHILINRFDLKFDPNSLCRALIDKHSWFDDKMEVVVNKNEMIPLPGTYQAGHLVKFVGE